MGATVELPITEPHVLINLIGAATETAARAAREDPRYVFALRADLYWDPTHRQFVVMPRKPRSWGKVPGQRGAWGLSCDKSWVLVDSITGEDMREGLSSRVWWRVIARAGFTLECRGEFRGPWPRIEIKYT
jgi:hypothetical protein